MKGILILFFVLYDLFQKEITGLNGCGPITGPAILKSLPSR